MTEKIYDTLIVGAGPAGLSAGIYAGRATLDTLIIESDQIGGQVTTTSEIWNYPAIQETNGTDLMHKMHQQALSFGVEFAKDQIEGYELNGDVKVLHGKKQDYRAYSVIIATGAKPRTLGFPGEDQYRGRGIAFCSTCDGELFADLEVFVVGGGFAAAEEADYLTRYASHVTVLVREDDFTCAPLTAKKALDNPKVTVKFNTEVKEVSGDDYLTDAVFVNNKTGETTHYHVKEGDRTFGMFIYVGTAPATKELKGLIALNEQGYILTDDNCQTNVAGVYAAGDVIDKKLRQIVTASSDGAIAATMAEEYVTALKNKLGIKVEPKKEIKPSKAQNPSSKVTQKTTPTKTHQGGWFGPEIRQQLDVVFGKMNQKLILAHHDNKTPKSQELGGFLQELVSLAPTKLSYQQIPATDATDRLLPAIEILKADQSSTKISFAGIPSGHELNSLALALYNAGGPGQALETDVLDRIKALPETKIQIGVSLTCHFCPAVVTACQHMAALNPNISAEMIDLQLFPEIRNERQIMSVPAIFINDDTTLFGSQTMEELLSACEQAAKA